MRKKWRQWLAASLSLLLLLQLLPVAGQAAAAPIADEKRFARAEPAIFQPSADETMTISWNWEVDHPTMIKLVSGEETIAVLMEETDYSGGYVAHQRVWDGRDVAGDFVPIGTYDLLIEPQDKYRKYGSRLAITILGEATPIAISPNRSSDIFTVYGTAVGVTDVALTLTTAAGLLTETKADVEGNRWSAEVELPPYTKVDIIADVKGSQPDKPSLSVINHPLRIFDNWDELGLQYYGDARKEADILQYNGLPAEADVSQLAGQRLLMIDPEYLSIPEQDPVLGGNLGIVDLFAGTSLLTPAHAGTGNGVAVSSDIVVEGSFPLFFTRMYNSQDSYMSELGAGYSHTFSDQLRDFGEAVIIRLEDGHMERYDLSEDGSYIAGDGIYSELEKQSNGTYILTTDEQQQYYFSAEGRLTRFSESPGVTMYLTYTNGKLSKVEELGNSLQFNYDQQGWLTAITDQAGRSVQYTYSDRQMQTFTDVEGRIYRYNYDAEGRLNEIIDPFGSVMQAVTYDDLGRITQIRYADGDGVEYTYNDAVNTITHKQFSGLETTFHYDADFRLTKVTDPSGERTYRYDVADQVTAQIASSSDDTSRTLAAIPVTGQSSSAGDAVLALGKQAVQAAMSVAFTEDMINDATANQDSYCDTASNWSAQTIYTGGDFAVYNGSLWKSKWWTLGEIPGGTYGGPWEIVTNCTAVEEEEPSDHNGCQLAEWQKSEVYVAGDKVQYGGQAWKAKWWTLGEVPTDVDWGVWQPITDCGENDTEEPGGEAPGNNGGGQAPGYGEDVPDPTEDGIEDEIIWAPDTGKQVVRAEMFNENRSDTYNTLYPWYRIYNTSERAIKLKDMRIRYFFTADSDDKLLFWGDWASIGSIHMDQGQTVAGKFISLEETGATVDTVLELSFPDGEDLLQPGEYVELHTRISKEKWADFTQSNDYSFRREGAEFAPWERIAVFVRGQWVWGSMPTVAALELDLPTYEEWELPHFKSKTTFVEHRDARGATNNYRLDDRGNLLQYTDALGGKQHFSYNGQNKLTLVQDELGREHRFTYDALGRMTSITDPAGHVTDYTYNEIGLPTLISLPDGSVVKAEYDARGNATRIVDPLGAVYERQFDEHNRLIKETNPAGDSMQYVYSPSGRLLEVIDELGYASKLQYDERGNIIEETNAQGGITKYVYNDAAQLIEQIDPLGQVTRYNYDRFGKLASTVEAGDIVTSYTYDLWGRMLEVTDAAGGVTKYEYDAEGNQTASINPSGAVTKYKYDLLGRLLEEIDPSGAVTRLVYDAAGQLIEEIDAAGGRTTYSYTPDGLLEAMTNALGHELRYEYTSTGLLAKIINEEQQATTYAYDANGRLSSEIDALGHITNYQYDVLGRLTTITNALDQVVQYTYDAKGNRTSLIDSAGHTSSYTYTALGQLASETNPLGQIKTYTYDALGQLSEVKDALGYRTAYHYNSAGDLVKQTRYGDNGSSQETSYQYDKLGNRTAVINPLGQQTKQRYDALGQLIETIDASGEVIKYTYDNSQRLLETNYSSGKQASYQYDLRGNMTQMKDWNGTNLFKYDALGQLLETTDYADRKVSYSWTPAGHKAMITMPNGQQIKYSYDGNGQLLTVEDGAGLTSYTYDALGQLTSKQAANGSKTTYSYDTRGLLTGQIERQQQGDLLYSHRYEYDAAGTLTNWQENRGGQVQNKSYSYDALNQLQQETIAGKRTNYEYDGFGNRIAKVVGTTSQPNTNTQQVTYTYNAANQLLEEQSGQTSKKYTYDAKGNITAIKQGTALLATYHFDETNKLVSATQNNTTLQYKYNAFGSRIQSNNQTTNQVQAYLIDLTSAYDDILAAYTDGVEVASYTYGLTRLHEQLASGDVHTYSYDHLGSVIGVQDEQGIVIGDYKYDAFGVLDVGHNSFGNTSPHAINFAYTGYPVEPTGLYFANARYYAPEIGRFISEDTYEGEMRNPLSLNRYVYVLNSPLRYTDPSGYCSFESWNKAGDCALDLLPVVGTVKGYQQAFVGENYITGEKLSTKDRWVEGVGSTVGLIPIPGAKHAGKAVTKGAIKTGEVIGDGAVALWNKGKKLFNKGCNCFTAGTKVLTDEGEKNIEDIEVGDKVLAKDENNSDGELAYKEVTALYTNYRNDIIKLYIGDLLIETTDNHPFWVEGKGWVFADELKVGDKLQKADGSNLTIDKVEFVLLDEPVMVYNFTVADYHTYYVTDIGIWVHNTDGCVKNVYNGIKNAPKYPEGFTVAQNGTVANTVKNKELLEKLRAIEPGEWKKMYKDGYDANGRKVSIHYFQSKSGKVFDVDVKSGWSNSSSR